MKRSFILMILSLSAPSAMAGVVEVETSFGIGTGTLDEATDLVWLNLSQSLSISWNDMAVARGPGGLYEGWRYGTSAELASLYASIGYNAVDPLADRVTQVQDIIAILGLGTISENPSNGFYRESGDGWLGDAAGLGHAIAGYGFDLSFGVPSTTWASSENWGSGTDTFASSRIGHWLVWDPACADEDMDGTCDADDVCPTDALDLDSDGDTVCDVDDFLLVIPEAPARGAQFTMQVERALPGTQVVFLATTQGDAGGPCTSVPSPVCTDLVAPKVLGKRPVGPAGKASLTITVPTGLPPGGPVWIQAIYSSPGGADTTQVLAYDLR